MKRNPHLQPLSRQHHNGLLIALLLAKGVRKNASATVMMDFICFNWKEDLQEHFELEENVLLPALTNTSFDHALTSQLLDEHRQIRDWVKKASSHEMSMDDLSAFSSLLDRHIRFEERVFFPAAEQILEESELTKIGLLLHDEHSKNCIHYPIKFWE